MHDICRNALLAGLVLALLAGSARAADAAGSKPIPATAAMLTQEQIATQHLEFTFGSSPPGQCGYVPNVVPPQISGDTSVGGTVTTWPGQWNPCSPPLVAVDVYWPSDGSHGTSHVVTPGDQAAGEVCSQSTVWDSQGDAGGPLTACIGIPGGPPPPSCVIDELQRPSITGNASVGSTLTMNGGSWQPSCGGGLSAADIRWWPDGSHSATYVVRSSDQGTSVCATVTVWDYNNASARDDACLDIPSAPPPPPPPTDTTPPSVLLTSPTAGAVLYDPTDVTANASDDVGVVGVQFKLDGNDLGAEDTAAPYAVHWDISTAAAGAHTLTAVARDAAGNRTTSAAVGVTTSDSVTDGVGVEQTTATVGLALSPACTSSAATGTDGTTGTCGTEPWCLGKNRAWGTAAAPTSPDKTPITYKNRLTGLVYWKASVAVDVCIDTAHHEVVAFGHQVVTPLYTLPLVWSYDNSPHWAFGPTGQGTKASWTQVTDSFTGCLYKIPIGCSHATFTAYFFIEGSGKYYYSVKFL